MSKTQTSKKRQRFTTRSSKIDLDKVKGLSRVHPIKDLVNPQKTALAMLECLQNNDPEGAMEMICIYLEALNKAKL